MNKQKLSQKHNPYSTFPKNIIPIPHPDGHLALSLTHHCLGTHMGNFSLQRK